MRGWKYQGALKAWNGGQRKTIKMVPSIASATLTPNLKVGENERLEVSRRIDVLEWRSEENH